MSGMKLTSAQRHVLEAMLGGKRLSRGKSSASWFLKDPRGYISARRTASHQHRG